MGETDPQVLAMWAATLGAAAGVLSAIVSFFAIFFSRLSSKEKMENDFEIAKMNFNANVISTNRQNWINELRDKTSEFLGLGIYIRASIENPQESDPDEVLQKTNRFHTLMGQVELMLNPTEKKNKKLMGLINKYYSMAVNRQYSITPDILKTKKFEIIELLKKILKEEWERVKKGE